MASAPASEPTLTTENRMVKAVSEPPRSWVTKRGKTTAKLKANTPITAIITSGTHRSGTLRT